MIRLLVVVALTACSPTTWRTPTNAETVHIDGDLVVRGESDGTTSVTARVMIDDVSATGFVRLRNADRSTAASSKHIRLARARAWYALAGIVSADPDRSLRAARQGADAIRYAVRLDTRAFMLANLSVRNNDVPDAARIMTEHLQFSLRVYIRRFHDEVW